VNFLEEGMMSDDTMGLGWLPVGAREDLEAKRDSASREEAERLIALDPRARLLALLDRAAGGAEDAAEVKLRPTDLRRVVESFAGAEEADEAELALRFPGLVDES
jgi:hypothetical protein